MIRIISLARTVLFAALALALLAACGSLNGTGTATVAASPAPATDTPQPTPTSTETVSQLNIYLIAVGDNGESGKKIGCNDSVVPVEITVVPTSQPLTVALNKLLAVEGREYEESGLYNALYQSDLSLEQVSLQDGEAIVYLTGTYQIGGVCDEPRVKAQLQETVLQFPEVQNATIYINGEPLE